MENEKQKFYSMPQEEVMKFYGSRESGLHEDQVAENREKYGKNKLYEAKKESVFKIFLDQFKDLLVIILIVSALLSIATGNMDSAIVIIAVLIMNAIIGTVQYVKAQKSLESLKKLSSPEAKVIRDGEQKVIDAESLVAGDIIVLDAGDIIPGDARLIETHRLKVNESAMTGESENAEKTEEVIEAGDAVALGDQRDMVFSGSLVTYGRAHAVVTGVGLNTELGRIASLMNDAGERKTPLQVTMDNFSKKLSIAIIALSAIVFGLCVYRHMPMTDSLLFAVALAVAAIPEALSSIITISLAIGTSRMANENAIIKDLDAVEGLGCVSIICSDKTGTLTQNRMTVINEVPVNEDVTHYMHLASILCNDTAIVDGETTGDPTETAFIDHYMKDHDDYYRIMDEHPRLSEVPFDSDRKLMSTLHKIDGEYIMFTKGAMDVILSRAANLTEDDKEKIFEENFSMANDGLRVLGFAMKRFPDEKTLSFDDEYELEYIGMMSEMDPPRNESAQAVADCRAAGIKPIMITGDHKVTASAIARKIDIMREGDLAVTGPELDAMDDDELNAKLAKISVYARVSPDNKIRIVKAWQDKGNIVAMTGDGVNDGPALKNADVGVAMGITGTEVAKDSASMILTDDNFATIIKSVLNGRNIYSNIRNAITYLLSGNFSGIIAVLYCSLLGLPMPFTAVQLLFINLITDSLPALAISMEPGDPALINDAPRKRDESILNKPTMSSIGASGVLIAISTMIAFYMGLGKIMPIEGVSYGAVTASTMAFATLCLARLWHGFNCRGRKNVFQLGITKNSFSIGAFAVGAIFLHMILLLPVFSTVFGVTSVNTHLIGWIWLLSFIPTLIIQIVKSFHKDA